MFPYLQTELNVWNVIILFNLERQCVIIESVVRRNHFHPSRKYMTVVLGSIVFGTIHIKMLYYYLKITYECCFLTVLSIYLQLKSYKKTNNLRSFARLRLRKLKTIRIWHVRLPDRKFCISQYVIEIKN
jgi:hypothetical protein